MLFKDENTQSQAEDKIFWNVLSKKILTPLMPQFTMATFDKFISNSSRHDKTSDIYTKPSLHSKRPAQKSRIESYIDQIKPRFLEDQVVSLSDFPISPKKHFVRFDINSPTNSKKQFFGDSVDAYDFNSEDCILQDNQFTKNSMVKHLLVGDSRLPQHEHDHEPEPTRRQSMFELPVNHLLDDSMQMQSDVDRGGFTYTITSIDEKVDRTERDKSKDRIRESRAPSLLFDNEFLSTTKYRHRGSRRLSSKREANIPVNEVMSEKTLQLIQNDQPLRRKSCSCRDCGYIPKMAMASTLFLAQDILLLRRLITKEAEEAPCAPKRKADVLGDLARNYIQKLNLSASAEQSMKRRIAMRLAKYFHLGKAIRMVTHNQQHPLQMLEHSRTLRNFTSSNSQMMTASPRLKRGYTSQISPIIMRTKSGLSKHSSSGVETPVSESRSPTTVRKEETFGPKFTFLSNEDNEHLSMEEGRKQSTPKAHEEESNRENYTSISTQKIGPYKSLSLFKGFDDAMKIEEKENENNETPLSEAKTRGSYDHQGPKPSRFSNAAENSQLVRTKTLYSKLQGETESPPHMQNPTDQTISRSSSKKILLLEHDLMTIAKGNQVDTPDSHSAMKKFTILNRTRTLHADSNDLIQPNSGRSNKDIDRSVREVIAKTGKHHGLLLHLEDQDKESKFKKQSPSKRFLSPRATVLPPLE